MLRQEYSGPMNPKHTVNFGRRELSPQRPTRHGLADLSDCRPFVRAGHGHRFILLANAHTSSAPTERALPASTKASSRVPHSPAIRKKSATATVIHMTYHCALFGYHIALTPSRSQDNERRASSRPPCETEGLRCFLVRYSSLRIALIPTGVSTSYGTGGTPAGKSTRERSCDSSCFNFSSISCCFCLRVIMSSR
jgi:hypothetical protein